MTGRAVRSLLTPALLVVAMGLAGCDGSGLLSGGSEATPIDAQVSHANGTVLQVDSARIGGEATLVNVRIINGRDREIELNAGNENTYLLTDTGEKRLLIPSPTNEDLAVPAGRTMDAALVFAGELPRNGTATLVINGGGSTDNRYANDPRFQIALPIGEVSRGGGVPEASALSNMRANAVSALRPAMAGGSSLGAGGQATSSLQTVQALKTELGAVETERGTVVSLPGDVTFDFDEATIRDNARGTLDQLAQLIQASGEGAITIEGHTDAKGDDDYNKRLSDQRAEAVKAYLATKGVSEARLRTIGLGELRPVAPNARPDGSDDEAGRQRNRRVEVILPTGASSATSSVAPGS